MNRDSMKEKQEMYVLVTANRYQELKQVEEEYKVLKALLFFFDDEPERAVDLMHRAVRYADYRKKETV